MSLIGSDDLSTVNARVFGNKLNKRRWLSWATTVCLFEIGCGIVAPGPPPTYLVKGKVTLNSVPIEKGEIVFHDSNKTNETSRSQIVNGAYMLRAKAGIKRVEITAPKKVDVIKRQRKNAKLPVTELPIMKEMIPEKYNTKSELMVDVAPNDKNELPFELKSE